jgi:hypothetical protein
MLTDSSYYEVFRKTVESKIQQLTDKAMNLKTSEQDTAVNKVRVSQLQDILSLTSGKAASLP